MSESIRRKLKRIEDLQDEIHYERGDLAELVLEQGPLERADLIRLFRDTLRYNMRPEGSVEYDSVAEWILEHANIPYTGGRDEVSTVIISSCQSQW